MKGFSWSVLAYHQRAQKSGVGQQCHMYAEVGALQLYGVVSCGPSSTFPVQQVLKSHWVEPMECPYSSGQW